MLKYILILSLFLTPGVAFATDRDLAIGSVEILDEGDDTASIMSVDVSQAVCDVDTNTVEPFHETVLKLGIYNNSGTAMTITSYRLTARNARSSGGTYRSRRFRTFHTLSPQTSPQPTELLFLSASDGQKSFLGSSEAIPASLGPRRVTVEVWGRKENGRPSRAAIRTTVNFTDLNRCP